MVNDRFLGAAWASVHAPSDPRSLLLWTLRNGFAGLVPGGSPRSIDWLGARAERARLPITFPAVRLGGILEVERRADGGLASAHPGDQEVAFARIAEAVSLA